MSGSGDRITGPTLPADDFGALIHGPAAMASGAETGPLSGRTFVAKDLFDVVGFATGAGNPEWLAAAPVAVAHATAVERLLEAGASLIGKAHTDELAYSLSGRNIHYGTPKNPAAPDRLPGGSSSGPAVAVAAGLCDLGLGSDTGGSIRVPASYCGVLGHRPTHGRVPLTGAVALAPTFDTAGLLARSGVLLRHGMRALMDSGRPPGSAAPPVRRLLLAADGVLQLDDDARSPWERALDSIGMAVEEVTLLPAANLDEWRIAFQTLQATEAWELRRSWFEAGPAVAADVEARFRSGSTSTAAERSGAQRTRNEVGARLRSLLGPGDALVIPAACGVAPVRELDGTEMDDVRRRTLNLTCTAGLAGAPSVSLPLASVGGHPVGVCLVGLPGDDEVLLDVAAQVLP